MVRSQIFASGPSSRGRSVGNEPGKTTRSATALFSTNRISAPRASRAVELLPTYLADARAVERYSPSTPDGALQLSVAENQMLEDVLIPSLKEFYSTQSFPADAIYYQPTHGRESFRKAMANYLQDVLALSNQMDPDGIVVGAGCNAVLENLCICLAEPGEGVMIPTPYYAAFEFDLVARAGKCKDYKLSSCAWHEILICGNIVRKSLIRIIHSPPYNHGLPVV